VGVGWLEGINCSTLVYAEGILHGEIAPPGIHATVVEPGSIETTSSTTISFPFIPEVFLTIGLLV
jgi:hypothetical protein